MNNTAKKLVFLKLCIAALGWLIAWTLTQGFFIAPKLLQFLPSWLHIGYASLTAYVLIVVVAAVVLLRKKQLLPKSRWLLAYLVPLGLAIAVPFHYSLLLNVTTFIFMIIVTTFWQDLLTFGILQAYLQKHVRPWISIGTTGVLFFIGHIVFFVPRIASADLPGWGAILGVGLIFAFARYKTKNIYLLDALHLSFLLLFV